MIGMGAIAAGGPVILPTSTLHRRSNYTMPALGQKQTFAMQNVMSALPLVADICSALADVRFVPKADIARTCAIWG